MVNMKTREKAVLVFLMSLFVCIMSANTVLLARAVKRTYLNHSIKNAVEDTRRELIRR